MVCHVDYYALIPLSTVYPRTSSFKDVEKFWLLFDDKSHEGATIMSIIVASVSLITDRIQVGAIRPG